MIKIDKDLSAVPPSLESDLTGRRRNELVENKGYIRESAYDSRYKQDDIKSALKTTYHGKYAYCEQDVSDHFFHIEHYRPKSVYYWLAYSWDNLLVCCDKCNVYKHAAFEIDGNDIAFSANDLGDIHRLAERYNEAEKPKLVHPELEDVRGRLKFTKKGKIDSDDPRVRYTIETCRIDRPSANDRRKKVYDDFMNRLRSRLYAYSVKNDTESLGALKSLIRDFIRDSENPENEYLAFRGWMLSCIPSRLRRIVMKAS